MIAKYLRSNLLTLIIASMVLITSCSDDDTKSMVEPGITISENPVDFGPIPVGETGEKEVTITGTEIADEISITVEGEFFSSATSTLPAEGGTITINFTPELDSEVGDYEGTISLVSDTVARSYTLSASITEGSVGIRGFYVVNEGGFGNGNTSISFYNRADNTITNDLFFSTNGVLLGDQAQSIAINESNAYIVVQNSAKIEVVDANDFTSVATIDQDLPSPRYFVGVSSSKGYVSDWGADGVSGTVRVVDLNSNSVSTTINTGRSGPNRMLLIGEELFVTNSGGFGRDSVITVINTATDQVSRTIVVGDNPNSIVQDADGNIWVASSGHTAFDPITFEVIEEESTPASILRINTNGDILTEFNYTEVGFGFGVSSLNINSIGDRIYYLYSSQIYELGITDTSLPSEAFASKFYYGLSVDPITNDVIGCEAPDFNSSGNIDIYTSTGTLDDTFSVGIGPNGCTYL